MSESATVLDRPQRWDKPFGKEMDAAAVDRLLAISPFDKMNAKDFPAHLPLRDILQNDTRIVVYENNDIVVRKGDYGNSAFLILSGTVEVFLFDVPESALGRRERKRKGLLRSIARLWTNPDQPEVRDPDRVRATAEMGDAHEEVRMKILVQDLPIAVDRNRTASMTTGQLFGELAALGRMARGATIRAVGKVELLEIRWQGLRELRLRSPELKKTVDEQYRKNALAVLLRGHPLFKHLTFNELAMVAHEAVFETYGNFEWFGSYKQLREASPAERLAAEPVIANQGDHPDGLILIRAAFARVSAAFGHGSRTISYLGVNQMYGLEELVHNYTADVPVPLQTTMRAVGYVDILRIPTRIVEKFVLDRIPREKVLQFVSYPRQLVFAPPAPSPASLTAEKAAASASPHPDTEHADQPAPASRQSETASSAAKPTQTPVSTLDTGALEFITDHRFMNGSAAMLIDIDRCTRCDDCVRACSAAHDNNPKFIRHGPVYGHHMVTNACMHCADPVCMIGCPTGAIHRSAQGPVVIDDQTCIGCQTCANSCPYGNIRMVEVRDARGEFIVDKKHLPILKATKCDLCIDEMGGPSCVRACPHDALIRMNMKDTESLATWLKR
jgi:Fe-S-cluster-containing dehydrogenase component/CRP-like cAMP-binding protein